MRSISENGAQYGLNQILFYNGCGSHRNHLPFAQCVACNLDMILMWWTEATLLWHLHLPPPPTHRQRDVDLQLLPHPMCPARQRQGGCPPSATGSACSGKKLHHRRGGVLCPAIRLWFHPADRHRDVLERWREVWTPMWLVPFRPQGEYAFLNLDFKPQNFLQAHFWKVKCEFCWMSAVRLEENLEFWAA